MLTKTVSSGPEGVVKTKIEWNLRVKKLPIVAGRIRIRNQEIGGFWAICRFAKLAKKFRGKGICSGIWVGG